MSFVDLQSSSFLKKSGSHFETCMWLTGFLNRTSPKEHLTSKPLK